MTENIDSDQSSESSDSESVEHQDAVSNEHPAPDLTSQVETAPPPNLSSTSPEESESGLPKSIKKFLLGKRKILVFGVAAAMLVIAVNSVIGGSSGGGGSDSVEYFAIDGDGALYLASLKDDQVVASTRLAEEFGSIVNYDSLDATKQQELTVLLVKNKYYVWNTEDRDDSILAFDKKSGISEVVYKGKDIDDVSFIADQNTFVVNDDSNCFAIPLGKLSIRIASNDCEIVGGRIFSRESESDGISIEEVSLTGESIGNFRLSITSSILLHDDGSLISGKTSDDVFEVYSTSDGKRLFRANTSESYNILDAASTSSDFLVSREDSDADDETLDVGVISVADGSASFSVLTSTYSTSGWISDDGSAALIFSRETQDSSTIDLDLWKVADKTSTSVVPGVGEVLVTAKDEDGRVAVITDREVIVGAFDTGFATRASGNFENGFVYSGPRGMLFKVGEDDKYDLLYVEDGVANDAGNRTVTLGTRLENVRLNNSSLAVEGVVYYSTESNNYSEIYRQELKDGSSPIRVAEGRIDGFFVDPAGVMSYYEADSDRIVGSFIQRNEKPESRVRVSDRNVYLPLSVRTNSTELRFVSQYLEFYSAFVDQDLKRCRSEGYPVLKTGASEDFTLTRENNSSYVTYAPSDYKFFCVSNASEIAFTSASRFDGESTRWVGIECSDAEGYDDSERGNLNNGEVTISMPGNGVQVCAIYDWSDYYTEYSYELDEYVDPVRGMNVTIEIR